MIVLAMLLPSLLVLGGMAAGLSLTPRLRANPTVRRLRGSLLLGAIAALAVTVLLLTGYGMDASAGRLVSAVASPLVGVVALGYPGVDGTAFVPLIPVAIGLAVTAVAFVVLEATHLSDLRRHT